MSDEWLAQWSHSKQYTKQVSNHCALIVKNNIKDWGPKTV